MWAKHLDAIRHVVRSTATGLAALDSEAPGLLGARAPRRFVACGSTAKGIDAALKDQGPGEAACLQSPAAFASARPSLDPSTLVVGVSMSGGSAEVVDVLQSAHRLGWPTLFLSREAGSKGLPRSLRLGFGGIGPRFLPLSACLLAHRLSGSGFGLDDLPPPSLEPDGPWPALAEFLESAYVSGKVPIFITAGDPFLGELLSSQYMEFLKRPSFHAAFPEWTHDLLWTLGPPAGNGFALVQLGQPEELSDRRAPRVAERLAGLGLPYLQAGELCGASRFPASRSLALSLILMAELAERLGLDPMAELSLSGKAQS